jgi:hypothetical protein
MLVGGNRISAWWLLLLIPILPIGVPSLLILFFALNNFAGVIFGPPAIWSRTWNAPPSADLVGRYVDRTLYATRSRPLIHLVSGSSWLDYPSKDGMRDL